MKTPLAWGLGAIALFGVLLVGVPDARANTPVQLDPAGHDVHSFEISLDGTTVVYRAESSPTPGIELFSVPVGGGPAVEIGAPFNLVTLPNYEITPDSTRVVYLEGTGCCGPFTLASVPIGGGAATPLFTESHTVSFQISPDSQHVVLTEHTLPVRLISVPITGGQPVELDSGAIGAFTISPDSTRVVYDKGGELRVAPLNGGAVRTLSQSVHAPDHFRITPDALTVVYRGLQPPTLLSVPITGGAPTRLSPVIEPAGPTDGVGSFELTEDGAWAVFEFDPGPGLARQIWAVPATGGAPRRVSPLPADPANQTSINFVIPPGSTTVLVEVDRALYAANLATGGAVELAPRVDSQALEGSATHGVYIDLDNNNELTSVPLSGGAGTQLTSTPFGVSFFSL